MKIVYLKLTCFSSKKLKKDKLLIYLTETFCKELQVTNEQRNAATASRLSQALEKAGLTQQELVFNSGVSKASISQYMHGTASPSPENAQKLARILKVDTGWLMGFDTPTKAGDVKKDVFAENYAELSDNEKTLFWEILQKLTSRN